MELLREPGTALERRIRLIENAAGEIQVQVFKVRHGPFSELFLKTLARKAREGVKVSLLTDGLYGRLPNELRTELESAGVRLRLSRRFDFLMPWRSLQRMHDKLLVVDRKFVLAGGRNLEEAAFALDPEKNLLDLEVLLDGLAAEVAADYFEQCWEEAHGAADFSFSVRHKNFVFLGGRDPARELYKALAAAEREIVLCSPYFIPSRRLFRVLSEARRHGVRVRVFTNSALTSDQPLAHAAYLNARGRLKRMGVEIREAQGDSVLHAKCALVDGAWVYLGSFNFDPRSENLNSESLFGIQEEGLYAEVLRSLEGFVSAREPARLQSPLLATALRPLAVLPFVRAQL